MPVTTTQQQTHAVNPVYPQELLRTLDALLAL